MSQRRLLTAAAIGAIFLLPGACSSGGSEDDGATIGGGADGSGAANGSGANGAGASGNGANGDGIALPDAGGRDRGDASCGESPIEASRRQVNMLILFDRSGSMDVTLPGFGGSLWDATTSALASILEDAKEHIDFGLDFYPNPDDPQGTAECGMPSGSELVVPIEAGETGVPKIIAALDDASPGGGTPMAASLKRALDYYTTGPGASLEGDKYVLLATDGGPNCNPSVDLCDADRCTQNMDNDGVCDFQGESNCCNIQGFAEPEKCLDDANTRAQIEALRSAGIPTFVFGIPGSEPYEEFLRKFAEAGGQARDGADHMYYRVDEEDGTAGLTDMLDSITRELITSCELQLTSEPEDREKINVDIDGARVYFEDDWELDTSTEPPTIVLIGETCEKVERDGAELVDVVFGCPTERGIR